MKIRVNDVDTVCIGTDVKSGGRRRSLYLSAMENGSVIWYVYLTPAQAKKIAAGLLAAVRVGEKP